MERLRKSINLLLAVALVGVAAVVAGRLVVTRPTPPRSAEGAPVPEVLAFEVAPSVFDAPVVGYGTIQPGNQVNIVPQVSGMLTGMHPDLAVGKNIAQGEVLFEVDPRAYESQVLQVEADIRMLEVQLERHRQQAANFRKRLEGANQQLALAREEWDREKKLLAEGATREVEVDAARQKYLQFEDAVIGYECQLALIPHLIAETEARIEARRAQLGDARRNRDNTRIACPFDARVDLVSARTSQVVVANLAIAVLTDLSALELPAVLDPSELQWTERRAYARVMGGDLGEPPTVTVRWTLHDQRYSWTGRVSRLERHDELTRTARVVIEIPQSLDEIRTSEGVGKPPLSVGMFCSAEIPAQPLADALVLPRSVVREDNVVCVFQPDPASPDGLTGRLALRRVPILRTINDQVMVDYAGRGQDDRLMASQALAECELRPGELVITSPVPRPVAGMALRLRTGDLPPTGLAEALTAPYDPPGVEGPARARLVQIVLSQLPPLHHDEVFAGGW